MISALLCLTLLQMPAQTERPALTAQKYEVSVCLRTAESPLLTPLYVTAVARQINDQLGSYFGPLARVRVVTSDHWLLDQHAHAPAHLPELNTIDLLKQETKEKAFVVYLDFHEGQYQIETRLIDTLNDQLGPVRQSTTPDRAWVAKAICLSIADSFSISATVTPGDVTGTASLWFQGEAHREQLLNVLGERCILQPLWVIQYGDGRIEHRPIPRTLLVWERKGPMHSAKVITSLSNPWPQRAIVSGFEAVKLDTRSGRLRLRILDRDTGKPVLNCNVSAGDTSFESLNEADRLNLPNRNGYVVSRQYFKHLAYVRVSQGSSIAMVPVAITDEVTDYVIRISSDNAISVKNELSRGLQFLLQDIQSLRSVHSKAMADFNGLNDDKRYEEALSRVKGAIEFINPRLSNAQSSFQDLQKEAEQLNMTGNGFYQSALRQIGSVAERQQELISLRESIGKAITTRDAQQRADVLIKLANDAASIGDFDEVIAKYELALAEHPDQPQLVEKLAQLKADWKVKNSAHGAAREFMEGQWASANVTQIESRLPQAKATFSTLKDNNDYFGATRLSHINEGLIGDLATLLGQLEQRGSEADAEETTRYAELVGEMADFQESVTQFMSQAPPTAPLASAPGSTPPSTSTPPATTPPGNAGNGESGSVLDLDLDDSEEEPLPE